MRNLPAGLAAAQQQPTVSPVISAVLRAKRGAAARLDPTTLYTNTLTEDAVAVAAPHDGTIVRARLNGGNVQTQHLAASAGFAWTTWGTIEAATAPAAGLGVALACLTDTLALVYVKTAATTTIRIRRSTDDGATWGAATDIANIGVITDLAAAYAPNGDLVIVSADNGGTIRAFRSNGGGAWSAAVTKVPPGAAAINSIAIAYSGADWLVIYGWQDATLNYLASSIYGNGGLQAANTWSATVDVLGIAPGSAATPYVTGFAWGSDGGHALIVEDWAILGGYAAIPAYLIHCSSASSFQGGYWTEPEPFPYSNTATALIGGPDLAYSQATAGQYVAAAENLVSLLAPPTDVDLSSRVLAFDFVAHSHSGSLTLTLDNSDQALTTLATTRSTIGLRCDLAIGYPVAGVNTTSPLPLRWVTRVESSWQAGRATLTLTAHDGWHLLHQLSARRQALFGTTLGLPTRTVDQLIHWLCAKAGIDYTAPAASTLRSRTPNWSLLPGHTLATAMLELLDKIEGFLLLTDSGATVIPLGAGEASTYGYGATGQHPLIQVWHTQELQPANLITVYTLSAGALPEALSAQAFDSGDGRLLGHTAHTHTDTQLEAANAQATANALLRKAQLSAPSHELACLPQVAQELGDVVTLTDPLTGTAYTARVRALSIHLDRDTATWQERLSLSAV